MRIVVDEMPKEPKSCPYAIYHEGVTTDDFYTCGKSSDNWDLCNSTSDCPYFVSFGDMLENYEVSTKEHWAEECGW